MVYVIKDTQDFNNKMNDFGSKLIVIDIYANWCIPCKQIAPLFEKLNDLYKDEVVLFKIDADDNNCQEICQTFEIESIPTFLFFNNYKYMINYRINSASIDHVIDNINQILEANNQNK
tara:strand:+ start:66 stop:419 length:354 start_codon:yes stop_codon:yes gene_type:complete